MKGITLFEDVPVLFARFPDIPLEIHDIIMEYYSLFKNEPGRRRRYLVQLTLPKLSQKQLAANKIVDISSGAKYMPTFYLQPHSDDPPCLYFISESCRILAERILPHRAAFEMPYPIGHPQGGIIIKQVMPIDFQGEDGLVITFPFQSHVLVDFLVNRLSPGPYHYTAPPEEVVGTMDRAGGDHRMLMGAAVVMSPKLSDRISFKKEKRAGTTVMCFQLCTIDRMVRVPLRAKMAGGRVKREVCNIRIGAGWYHKWMRLFEKIEIEGANLTAEDL